MTPSEIQDLQSYLTPEEVAELDALIAADIQDRPFSPLAGPQTMAYESTADVVGFGGAAGGGKTDLAVGKALTQHQVAQIFRREGTELNAIIDRLETIVGHRDGLGGKPYLGQVAITGERIVYAGPPRRIRSKASIDAMPYGPAQQAAVKQYQADLLAAMNIRKPVPDAQLSLL
mgnify:CR=1 FL=1